MEKTKLNIAGRNYQLQTNASDLDHLEQAAHEVNAKFEVFKRQFQVEDSIDLLAMTSLHFASETIKLQDRSSGDSNATTAENTSELPENFFQRIDLLSKRIQSSMEI